MQDSGEIARELIETYSRIALMAQVVDVFCTGNGVDAARREVRHRSGSCFDPAIVAAFERVAFVRGVTIALILFILVLLGVVAIA